MLEDYIRRDRAGKPAVDPWVPAAATYLKEMEKLGLQGRRTGKSSRTRRPAK